MINLLNKVSTPLSRSMMPNSSTYSCSSLHVTLFFWNAFDTRAHLLEFGVAICFDGSSIEDPIVVTAASLASVNNLTALQLSRSAGEDFLVLFLSCFCALLIWWNQDWILVWRATSSLLLITYCIYWMLALSSEKLTCMTLQRSSKMRERSSLALQQSFGVVCRG